MKSPPFPFEVRRRFWQGVRAGLSVEQAAVAASASATWGKVVFDEAGGVKSSGSARASGSGTVPCSTI